MKGGTSIKRGCTTATQWLRSDDRPRPSVGHDYQLRGPSRRSCTVSSPNSIAAVEAASSVQAA